MGAARDRVSSVGKRFTDGLTLGLVRPVQSRLEEAAGSRVNLLPRLKPMRPDHATVATDSARERSANDCEQSRSSLARGPGPGPPSGV
jgi:hypothetical protein